MPLPDPELKVDEVLPPQVNPIAAKLAASKDPADRATARILAKYLDELLSIPGTNFKIGLDPILALIPGVGDTVASGAGVIILLDALRSGVSIPVFLRMALNMGINFLIGLVPGLGAAGSAFFKSNSRNLALLTTWQAGHKDKVKRSTLRFYGGLAILLAMIVLLIVIGWLFYAWIFYSLLRSAAGALGIQA
ncbi:DUF4112 domain-containing protein [Prosthecobacter sp.]|jgi:hypothetical protein|uniref:DUF4112 domain-containing protein n=1 Tax=Prosthecobacter sp. TaxID=1965333 RepID=UPI00378390F5